MKNDLKAGTVLSRNNTKTKKYTRRMKSAFSLLLHSTPNLMIITGKDSKVRFLSDKMAEFINYPDKELAIGQPLLDLFNDKEMKILFSDILDAECFMERIVNIEINNNKKHYKIVSDVLSGDSKGVFIELMDITETVQSHLSAIEAKAEAERANKSKSDFLAAISHEIRTPLNEIIGIAQIQLQKNIADERLQAFKMIHTSGNNLLGIINDILDMSKIDSGKMELNPSDYNVQDLINDTIQLNIMRIGSKPIEFLTEIDESLPPALFGDELRIKQILNNLLSNAIKYTEKGYVKLSVIHTCEEENIILNITVEDSGQGMKEEDQQKLFSEYLRFNAEANRKTEGTGLGLTIVKRLTQMMDGIISVKSEFGKGSVFSVTVKQKISTNKIEQGSGKINYESMPNGRVLVVDDVETNLFVAQGLLSFYKLNVDTARSGKEVLSKIMEGRSNDLIFMDHMMPEMDGIEATKQIRSLGYDKPIAALSANAVVGQSDVFKQNGFNDFLSKPIDVKQLDLLLHKYLKDQKSTNQASTEVSSSLFLNKEIEGLDIAKGLEKYGGNEKIYTQLMRSFASSISALIDAAEKFDKSDIFNYQIKIHGIKGACLEFFAVNIGKMAGDLEEAAKAVNIDFINSNNNAFIQTVRKLILDVNNLLLSIDAKNIKPVKDYPDNSLLLELLEACRNYDLDEADKAFYEIDKYQYKNDKGLIVLLRENFDKMDYSQITEILSNLTKQQEN